MLSLGIETSCDETSIALVEKGAKIRSLVTASQIDLHCLYGGVVPELASRRHCQLLVPLLAEALKKAHCSLEEVDLFAATYAPGLVGALMTGLTFAKTLALASSKPFVGVHHLKAHLYGALLSDTSHFISPTLSKEKLSNYRLKKELFPALGIIISGGHCDMVLLEDWHHLKRVGYSIDDAPGEAFDKVAQLLDLPYPGGPHIEERARSLSEREKNSAPRFTPPQVKNSPHIFSFSGLKTQVYYEVKKLRAQKLKTQELQLRKDQIAYAFQETLARSLTDKTRLHLEQRKSEQEHLAPLQTLLVGGGVSANEQLRAQFQHLASQEGLTLVWPTKELSLDQAAMIAGAGALQYEQCGPSPLELEAQSRVSIDQ